MRASECPASNCSISSLMLAAMSSCLVVGFLLSMVVTVLVVAVLLMVFVSFAVAFAFHAVRGMYLHAERLLAKAGRQSARGGVSPTLGAKRRASEAEVCTSEARKTGETPCAARGQSPQRRFGFLIRARQRT